MKFTKKSIRRLCVGVFLLSTYPAFVLGYTWYHVLQSPLEGGRHGPLDAYRHTLASAVVSYTLGKWAVTLVSEVMESGDKKSQEMDRHNNSVGASIGKQCSSFSDIERLVSEAVSKGRVGEFKKNQTTWLDKAEWKNGRFW